jgi:hypothetical protein
MPPELNHTTGHRPFCNYAPIPLACATNQSDECPDRGINRARSLKMKTFTIDAENNITAHGSAEEAVAGAERFTTEGELNKLAAGWHSDGLVEIWNSLPGATPVKKFKDRKTAVSRVWKAIAGLGETKAPVAPQKPSVAPAKGKSAQNATPAKKGPKAPKGGKKADKSEKPTKYSSC